MLEKYEQNGVIFKDKNNVYIDDDVIIKKGCVIYPNVSIRGKCIIEEDNIIDMNTIIEDSKIGKNNKIGPSAHIHTDSKIGSNNTIGNFVEIKHSVLEDNIKVKHLSYVGDAYISNNCNIGAGVVFANYSSFGAKKETTKLENDVFIGSNAVLIAPLEIKEHSLVAANSTITKSISPYSLAIARNTQTTKEGYLNKKKA